MLPRAHVVTTFSTPLARSYRRGASPEAVSFPAAAIQLSARIALLRRAKARWFLFGGSPALCSRAEPGPCVCDAQGSESQGDETHIYLQICPFQIGIQSFLALPPGELSPQATERVCCLLPSPSSLRSATSPKGRGKEPAFTWLSVQPFLAAFFLCSQPSSAAFPVYPVPAGVRIPAGRAWSSPARAYCALPQALC